MENRQPNCKILALITIIDYSQGDMAAALFHKNNLPINIMTHGHGAAKPELYDILGFGEPKKAVILSLLAEPQTQHILQKLRTELRFDKPGRGIAFTLPINGIGSLLSQLCMNANGKTNYESEDVVMQQNEEYDLIITIINSGHFDQVMEAAKAAGAKGGTLLHARGLANEDTAKFLGITIQPEKDVLLILASHDQKHMIMESITKVAGLSTEGKGICFSLHVNDALGIRGVQPI